METVDKKRLAVTPRIPRGPDVKMNMLRQDLQQSSSRRYRYLSENPKTQLYRAQARRECLAILLDIDAVLCKTCDPKTRKVYSETALLQSPDFGSAEDVVFSRCAEVQTTSIIPSSANRSKVSVPYQSMSKESVRSHVQEEARNLIGFVSSVRG